MGEHLRAIDPTDGEQREGHGGDARVGRDPGFQGIESEDLPDVPQLVTPGILRSISIGSWPAKQARPI